MPPNRPAKNMSNECLRYAKVSRNCSLRFTFAYCPNLLHFFFCEFCTRVFLSVHRGRLHSTFSRSIGHVLGLSAYT